MRSILIKSIFRKIALTFFSLILGYNLIKLSTVLIGFSKEGISILVSLIAATAIILLGTGCIAFLGFAFPTHQLLPKSYYRLKNIERLKFLYSILGVRIFQKFLLLTFYRKKENKKYFNGTKSGIKDFDYNTRQSEFGHLIAFILIELLAITFLVKNLTILFLWIQPLNLLMNFYPIVLQRFHRIQTEKILNKINQKNTIEFKA